MWKAATRTEVQGGSTLEEPSTSIHRPRVGGSNPSPATIAIKALVRRRQGLVLSTKRPPGTLLANYVAVSPARLKSSRRRAGISGSL